MGRGKPLPQPEDWIWEFGVIGKNVKLALTARQMTAYRLAKRLHTSTTGIYNQLKDGREPELSTLLKWAVAIGVDLNVLVRGVNALYDEALNSPDLLRQTRTRSSPSNGVPVTQEGVRGSSLPASSTGPLDERTEVDEALRVIRKRTDRHVVGVPDGERPARTERTEPDTRRRRRKAHR